jgi:uncharacterized protein
MKLPFEEIEGRPVSYIISDDGWLPEEGMLLSAAATVTVRREQREVVLLEGKIDGKRLVPCDRCGSDVSAVLSAAFFYRVTTRAEEELGTAERECLDEDIVTLHLSDPLIDVGAILREQVYLSIPLKTLCRTDCKGLCTGCGADLNDETCRCLPDSSRSPFSVLKKLTDNEHKQ